MADIKTLVDELQTVATAFTGIESVIYGRASSINWKDRAKNYTCLLIDSNPDIRSGGSNKSFLPQKSTYRFKFLLLDEFPVEEQNQKTLQEKQKELQLKMDQFIAEVQRRAIADPSKGFLITGYENISGFFGFPVYNDKLAEVVYNVSFDVVSSCTLGTFNY